MNSMAGLVKNSTDLLYPDIDEAKSIAELSQAPTSPRITELIGNNTTEQAWRRPRYAVPTRVCGLVPIDATKQVEQYSINPFRDSFEHTIIEFSDAIELQFMDIVAGSISVNKSVFDDSPSNQVVEEQLERLFSAADEEQFEVGIESQFSRGLQRLCAYDPVAALQSLKAKLIDGDAGSEVLAESLRWASRQEAVPIRDLVVELLSTGLHHASSLVRDAAALSLAYLDQGAAIVQLQHALEREKVPELREDLEDLIRSLEN